MFYRIKSNQNIQPINIFDHDFLYTAYAGKTTFLSKEGFCNILNAFDKYYSISGLKSNKSKYKIAGIGILKGVKAGIYASTSVCGHFSPKIQFFYCLLSSVAPW